MEPDLLNMTRRSSSERIPMSPWSASVGLRKTAFVPVETRVMEIFWAMNPLFPMPEKKMTPLQFIIAFARSVSGPCCVHASAGALEPRGDRVHQRRVRLLRDLGAVRHGTLHLLRSNLFSVFSLCSVFSLVSVF